MPTYTEEQQRQAQAGAQAPQPGPVAMPSQQTATPAPAPQQTFAQMQAAGQARPAPAPAQPAAPSASVPGSTANYQQLLSKLMANPSSYNTDAMRREYDRSASQIDDQTTLAMRSLEGEMARRGLHDSSIAGDRTRGLIYQQRDAKTNLADSLLQKLAETQSSDLRSAIGLGMTADQNLFDRGIAQQGLDLQGRGLGLQEQQLLNAIKNSDRSFAETQRQFDTGTLLDRDRMAEARRQFDAGYGLDQQRFGLSQQEVADRRAQFEQQMGETQRQYDASRSDNNRQFDLQSLLKFFDVLGGADGLGGLGGNTAPPPSGAPQTGGYTPASATGGIGGGSYDPQSLADLLTRMY